MQDLIIKKINGTGLPLIGNDIDTDRIMPARYLKELTFNNLGKYVFFDEILAMKKKGEIHPFANPEFSSAKFLIVNSNFGCGSSREHAPQGILRFGIQCILGESFSEIFFSNCYSIGLPCLKLSASNIQEIQKLCQAIPQTKLELNLEADSLSVGPNKFSYFLDFGLKNAFTTGNWDQTKALIENMDLIERKRASLDYLKT